MSGDGEVRRGRSVVSLGDRSRGVAEGCLRCFAAELGMGLKHWIWRNRGRRELQAGCLFF